MDYSYNSALIDHESRGDFKANSKGSSYYGLGQFSEVSAAPYLKKMGSNWNEYLNNADVQRQVLDMETVNNEAMMNRYHTRKGNPGREITDLDRWEAHNVGELNWRRMASGDFENENLLKAIRNQAGSPQDVAAYRAQYSPMFHGGDKFARTEVQGAYPAPDSMMADTTALPNILDQPSLTPNPKIKMAPRRQAMNMGNRGISIGNNPLAAARGLGMFT